MPDHQSSRLALLPNELLSVVAEFLTIPELRLLGRTNRRFRAFSDDYLPRLRYTSAFFRLPTKILFGIADYVSEKTGRSRFARVSQKFYPCLMEHLVRHDILNNQSRCLVQVTRKNNEEMVRKIMALGGHWDMEPWDHEDQYWETQGWSRESWDLSPLGIAAYHGYNTLVRLLLKSGASHYMYDGRTPLDWALHCGHEETSRILCAGVCEGKVMKTGHTFLYMICYRGFVDLTRQVLERGMQNQPCEEGARLRSCILNALLKCGTFSQYRFMPRVTPNLHHITKLLLDHGADPDYEYPLWPTSANSMVTTNQQLGLLSPDPRVKMLFVRDISDLDHNKELASSVGLY